MSELSILGAGVAYPHNRISNEFLEEVGKGISARQIEEQYGIVGRATVLSLEYIRETGNLEVFRSPEVTQSETTELGFKAALQAIERAGIKPEDIGLVLGDSSTPIETTPSEGQRIANRLGLRCPAFDVFSSSGSFALQMDTLFSWRPEVLPEYVLCVFSNTPTTRVNYREGLGRLVCGDCGSAVVVSTRKVGKFQVKDTHFASNAGFSDLMSVETLGHMEMRDDALSEFIEPKTDEMFLRAVERNKLSAKSLYFLGTQLSAAMLQSICQRHGIKSEQQLQNVREQGYSFGSAPAAVLADLWEKIRAGSDVVVSIAGAGMSFGYVYLKA